MIATGNAVATGERRNGWHTTLVAMAESLVAGVRLEYRNLFVLDAHFTVVHANPEAERSARLAEADLRRVFGLGAADLSGTSLLRFHPAPTQLQGILAGQTNLHRETTWSFGRTTWKAQAFVIADAGGLLGYAVAWRDETEASRAADIFRRLRAEAEELPVPLMYPDRACELWYGNAACEVALERLAPYLPFAVNPLEGVPARLFFPDVAERQAIFSDPDRLPHKRQLQLGPETISILVSAVRDQEQRFIGPQITWEIVYFTRSEPGVSAATEEPLVVLEVVPPSVVSIPVAQAAPVAPGESAAVLRLQQGARILEQAGRELQDLAALVQSVALLTSQAAGETAPLTDAGQTEADLVARQVSAAVEALNLARQGGSGTRPAVHAALERLGGLARQTNLLALQSAAEVLQEDAEIAGTTLDTAVNELSAGLADRVAATISLAQSTADTLHAAGIRRNRLRALQAVLGDPDPRVEV
jgi:hypothetical protein